MAAQRRSGLWTILFGIVVPGLISVPLVLGFLGGWHAAFDSLSHFRGHLAVLLAMAGVLAGIAGSWREAVASVLLAAAALSTTAVDHRLPFLSSAAVAAAPDEPQAVYRLMQMNLRFDNATPELALSAIGRTGPDVITANEVSMMWVRKLELIAAAYPFRVICPSTSRIGGSAILSRRPFSEGTETYCLEDGRIAIATVDFGGRPVRVIAIHLHWPWPFQQHDQVERIAPLLAEAGPQAFVSGDFNAAGWSATARRVAALAQMTPVPPTGATWLDRSLPLALRGFIGLPLDHVLAGSDIRVLSAATGGDTGADHAPIVVEFSLPEPPALEEPDEATAMASLLR